MSYEVQFLSDLEKLVRSLDRRVTHGKERLRKSAEAKEKVCLPLHNASIVHGNTAPPANVWLSRGWGQ